MQRAFILLLDSFGIGAASDAAKFGDSSANTLLHIAQACANGAGDVAGLRSGPLKLPNLTRYGLNAALKASCGEWAPGLANDVELAGLYGYAAELSRGKDTPSGHWEITGVPVLFDWNYFPDSYPSFPDELVQDFVQKANLPGILGNCHFSGTEIIKKFGDEHVKTGKPICYTSADSVFQIAVHEESFGLERLYEICKIAYELMPHYNILRVIARPFSGTSGNYYRTANRRDFSVPPPELTLLDKLVASGCNTVSIGKIADIFAHRGISQEITAHGNSEVFDAVLTQAREAKDKSLVFANFVDFDMNYGHRRDVAGYAAALEYFDRRLPEFIALLGINDVVVITADHGCDPTYRGTDHTREFIPVLVFGPSIKPYCIGKRDTFADIGQSLAHYFDINPLAFGTTFL